MMTIFFNGCSAKVGSRYRGKIEGECDLTSSTLSMHINMSNFKAKMDVARACMECRKRVSQVDKATSSRSCILENRLII